MSELTRPAKAKGGKRRVLRIVLGVLAAILIVLGLVFGGLGLSVGPHVILMAQRQKLVNEMTQVQTGVLGYYTEYGIYPAAPDNATLIKMLTGNSAQGNSRQIAFLTFKPSDQDAKGELLDPWGTPIEFSVTVDGTLQARSAGPDKIFGTADDITSH